MRESRDFRRLALEPIERLHQLEYEGDAYIFERWAEKCQSPIEHMLAGQLYAATLLGNRFEPCGHYIVGCETRNTSDAERFPKGIKVEVWPQEKVGRYLVDFLLIGGPRQSDNALIYIVVECDGHDYHERTKEQAAHDRGRDRAMQAAGAHVLRFTGSEIYRNPEKCCLEILSFLEEKIYDDPAFVALRRPRS
jgi:very-short-patch-repair endonuclease